MLRVLFLINSLDGGGAERVLVNLVNRMDKNKYEVTVRVLVDSGINREALVPWIRYEKIFKHGFRGINLLDKVPGIYSIIAHGEYDVIVVYLHGVLTRIVSKAPIKQKTIAYLHANMEESPFMRQLLKSKQAERVFNTYDRIVAVSQDVADSFVKMTGIKEKLCIKYNTFDVDGMLEAAKESVEEINNNPNDILLCSIGKIEEVKGYLRMIPVLAKLRDAGLKFHWVIVGEGSQRKQLEGLIRTKQLEDRVTLVGFQKNPYKYLNKCDLFVCSSVSEGFSSVVAESLILGIPVLTTDCNGMREMVGDHNEYGVIVENSEEGLYNGLKDFLTANEKLEEYRKYAKKRATFFMPESTVRAVERMIDEVVDK